MHASSPAAPQRHDLLQLRADGWSLIVAADAAMASSPLLREWVARGRPVMRRRRMHTDPAQTIPAAIALPLDASTRRIAFTVPDNAVLAWTRPPLLSEVLDAAPAAWSRGLEHLLRVGQLHGSGPRVFGSLMWQSVTGLRYLRDGSDLDLLWPVDQVPDLVALLRDIATVAARSVPRVDGEVLFQGGEAVQWSELLDVIEHDGGSVLVKSMDHARLVPVTVLHRRRDAA